MGRSQGTRAVVGTGFVGADRSNLFYPVSPNHSVDQQLDPVTALLKRRLVQADAQPGTERLDRPGPGLNVRTSIASGRETSTSRSPCRPQLERASRSVTGRRNSPGSQPPPRPCSRSCATASGRGQTSSIVGPPPDVEAVRREGARPRAFVVAGDGRSLLAHANVVATGARPARSLASGTGRAAEATAHQRTRDVRTSHRLDSLGDSLLATSRSEQIAPGPPGPGSGR